MRDISTEDLIQTLIIKSEAAERARAIYALHPTGQNARAKTARDRDQRNALRALHTHLREVERLVKATQHIKMPRSFIALSRRLPARTVAALRNAGVKHPETMPLEDLLRLPNIGVQGAACIAMRSYSPHTTPIAWPELNDDD